MAKSATAFRTINEVAKWLGVEQHVLRYWETRFPQIKPMKRAGGRRYYRPEDMQLVGGIKTLLYDQGSKIRDVQSLLRSQGVRAISEYAPPIDETPATPKDIPQNKPPQRAVEPAMQIPPAVQSPLPLPAPPAPVDPSQFSFAFLDDTGPASPIDPTPIPAPQADIPPRVSAAPLAQKAKKKRALPKAGSGGPLDDLRAIAAHAPDGTAHDRAAYQRALAALDEISNAYWGKMPLRQR
jgi:DNA-binding transcriptional MerR regulator